MEHEELVKAAVKGDKEAFYQLILCYSESLYKIAYCYLKNEEEALEAIQETTCRAFVKLDKLKQPEYFKTWVTRILINYCVDEQKKRKRFLSIIKEEAARHEEATIDSIDVSRAIQRLKPNYRHVIILKYYQDMPISDIAKILGCPEGTVKSWLYRALGILKKSLGEEGDFNV